MTVHDNVAVAAKVSDILPFSTFSEIWAFEVIFFKCVSLARKWVTVGRPNDCVCDDSVRHLPNMNAVRKFLCVPEEITENR